MSRDGLMHLLTIGHGTISTEEFIGLIRGAGAARLIDIRSAPGSRHNPQFGRADMERWLAAASIAYQWERALGGFRKPRRSLQTLHCATQPSADTLITC